MRIVSIIFMVLAFCSCTQHVVKLPKTRITPSPYFLPPSYYSGTGANFFSDSELLVLEPAPIKRGMSQEASRKTQ